MNFRSVETTTRDLVLAVIIQDHQNKANWKKSFYNAQNAIFPL